MILLRAVIERRTSRTCSQTNLHQCDG